MSTAGAATMEIRIDTTSPTLRKLDGEVDPQAVARVLYTLASTLLDQGMTPSGVWGGRLSERGHWVGYWTLHAGGESE